jgi:inhibitor of cysteine peptidase
MRRWLFSIALATLALGPMACAADTDEESASGQSEELRAKTITEDDNGKTIQVALGQSFTIRLGSNPTSGYRWTLPSVDRTLGYPKESYKASGEQKGSGGEQRFTWSTKSPLNLEGTYTISLIYQRPWAETAPPEKRFSVTVRIGNPSSDAPSPEYCKDGKLVSEPGYIDSADGKECRMPNLHCLTKDPNACPMLSPPSPDYCKDGIVQSEPGYMQASDGKECSIPRLHCLTKDLNACPLFSPPRDPTFCEDGTIERGRTFIESGDGKECAMPTMHCVTKDLNACPVQ